MADTQPIITLDNVSKVFQIPHEKRVTMREHVVHLFRPVHYEQLRAVDQVSLSIQKGEFIGIVGRNGSGKSTLLKLLSGIYPPTSGTLSVHGTVSPFLELGVGFHPELSAHDNIFLYGSVLGMSRAHLQSRFDDIIRFAELERFVDTKLKNFSSGMWVRLAFSVAIEMDADIYLIDEVLAVGDLGFQQKCFDVFRRLKEQGKTAIFVSHGLDAVKKLCGRCVYMRQGKAVSIGGVEETVQQYMAEVE